MNYSKKRQHKHISQIIICVVLFCAGFSGVILLNTYSADHEELVYCPLQRKWVEVSEKPIRIKYSLDEICAIGETKDSFAEAFTDNLSLIAFNSKKIDNEKLFFEYSAKGDRAFVELNHSHQFPQKEISIFAGSQKISSIYRNEFAEQRSSTPIEINSARPPTILLIATKFEFPAVQKLTNISHQILARPPPIKFS